MFTSASTPSSCSAASAGCIFMAAMTASSPPAASTAASPAVPNAMLPNAEQHLRCTAASARWALPAASTASSPRCSRIAASPSPPTTMLERAVQPLTWSSTSSSAALIIASTTTAMLSTARRAERPSGFSAICASAWQPLACTSERASLFMIAKMKAAASAGVPGGVAGTRPSGFCGRLDASENDALLSISSPSTEAGTSTPSGSSAPP
mmetsp:Transcript_47369/g.94494  ORF Transcript_47369/g.94494 Transcript_47369/m.94494 type:complete len:209 (+) Transcript_47369:252-878(+)